MEIPQRCISRMLTSATYVFQYKLPICFGARLSMGKIGVALVKEGNDNAGGTIVIIKGKASPWLTNKRTSKTNFVLWELVWLPVIDRSSGASLGWICFCEFDQQMDDYSLQSRLPEMRFTQRLWDVNALSGMWRFTERDVWMVWNGPMGKTSRRRVCIFGWTFGCWCLHSWTNYPSFGGSTGKSCDCTVSFRLGWPWPYRIAPGLSRYTNMTGQFCKLKEDYGVLDLGEKWIGIPRSSMAV